ncbi:MAG: S8 family serine peptidase, partial [bacterium]
DIPGIAVTSVHGQHLLASALVQALARLTSLEVVEQVGVVQRGHLPQRPRRFRPELKPVPLEMRGEEPFNRQGLTGDGVIVGIIDTGIDWRHEDFCHADGSTRILYLWDMVDTSYEDSDGDIGQEAPVNQEFLGVVMDLSLGTLYSAADIDRALAGGDVCNAADSYGHGTACASVAAGDGSATDNGVPAGTWAGIAPEADIIVVRAGAESFDDDYLEAVEWVFTKADELGRPCVINLSLGGHYSAHDGYEPEEQFLNDLVGAGRPGRVICASAGNEGRESFHAGVRYGPAVDGQADVESAAIEVFVKEHTELHAYFPREDDWGLALMGRDEFLMDDWGDPAIAYIHAIDDVMNIASSYYLPVDSLLDWYHTFVFTDEGLSHERLVIPLPPGDYYAWAYGPTEKVADGVCDLYFPIPAHGSFGDGTVKSAMVGTPGNADNLITVGSYDFRVNWSNVDGGTTQYNLEDGGISDYSSPGYRRDGVIKPDIAAPGRFAVSALAVGSTMAEEGGSSHTTSDGYHLAWEGTSAAAPYVAGVVALMLQKNPDLDAPRIKEILQRTATNDRQTGSTPNPVWGHGKINPEAALKATPAPGDE